MRRLLSFLPVLAGILMLMAVVLINGRPSVFTDTDDYFVEGRTFAYTMAYALHLKAPDPPPISADDIADAKQAAEDLHMSHTEVGARSPYYGALLYVSQRIGTIWLTTAIQAAIGAWLVFLLWRAAAPGAAVWTAYAAEAAVAFGSSLPFFAGFIMPDVFSGYAAVSAVLLLIFWERLAWLERSALALLLTAAITFHASHLLDVGAVLVMSGLLYRFFRARPRAVIAQVATVCLCIAAAASASFAYKEAVKLKTGDEMRRPPFLAMRVIADGPGREFLRARCGHGAHYALCQFKNLPLDDSQDMLWSDDRRKGIFNVTTYENRLQMEREENRFVLDAVAFDPIGQVVASLTNWGEQLFMVYLDDPIKNPHYFLTNAYWSTTNLPWLIDHAADCGRDHWGCSPRLSVVGSEWLFGFLTAVGALIVIWRVCRSDLQSPIARRKLDWGDDRARLVAVLALLMGAVLINAFVCGALSGPFARYQARITWLVTAAAAISMISAMPLMATWPAPAWVNGVRAAAAGPGVRAADRPGVHPLRHGRGGGFHRRCAGAARHGRGFRAQSVHRPADLVQRRGLRHLAAQPQLHLPPSDPARSGAPGLPLRPGPGRWRAGQYRGLFGRHRPGAGAEGHAPDPAGHRLGGRPLPDLRRLQAPGLPRGRRGDPARAVLAAMPDIEITVAPAERRGVFENLIQLYAHDFSEFASARSPLDLGEDGRFAAYPLDAYWCEPGHVPLLIHADARLAGFALLNGASHSGERVERNMAEFFIARKYRRGGVGRLAAHAIFSRYPGLWEAAVARRNLAALAFWRAAVAAHPLARDVREVDVTTPAWDGPILRFRV